MTGAQIFIKLLKFNLHYSDFDWLENRGLSEFELLISVILTQNTNWKNVLKLSLKLKKNCFAVRPLLLALKVANSLALACKRSLS